MALLEPGDRAPDFAVVAHDGRTVRLRDLAGRHVLLWFYPEADTPGCTIEGRGLRDRAAQFAAADTAILGVSFDAVEKNRAFAAKLGFEFPLLCDTERVLGRAYDAIDPDDPDWPRRISYLIGPDQTIVRTYPEVDVNQHADDVLADLGAVRVG